MQPDEVACAKKLAPCLHIKIPKSKTSNPLSIICVENSSNIGNFQQDGQQLQDMTVGRLDKLLVEIQRDLQQIRDSDKSADEDQEKRDDWRIAADVLNRIFLILFGILVVGGTIVFFVMFAVVHHNPDD